MISMKLMQIFRHRSRGQIGIYLLMSLIIDIIITAALAPLIDTVLNFLYASIPAGDAVSLMLAHLIFPALMFSIIFGILEYKDPLQQRVY